MQTRGIAPALLLLLSATALLLTGCSGQSTDHAAEKPTASASASAPAGDYTPAPYENACDGEQAVISGTAGKHEIKKCDAVAVASDGGRITVGTARTMVVEGSDNDITVASLESLTLLGSNNAVHVTGDAPSVDDQGDGNTVD
ncbi:DUF3060 domain-containing protein [Curtobacterium herbarum]|uniref:DUF3060 domain-containing protein n=1 Tax=Curtobacterium herbarum TaxID=150122 RepID=A0ABP4K5M5_9MICO|nr:DUF3060 domain-containing protein [Curtobacterium herbarum]MBM7476610.1 Flp pilus assembly protein TadG [Curtobacterium herbarum]MCS6543828.1 DUF3060 domain-containing protein [Curtobacterium herbarum]